MDGLTNELYKKYETKFCSGSETFRFGFGNTFREWIKILYTDNISCIKCNGYVKEYFKKTRSIRQGCLFLALLYTMVFGYES